MEGCRGRTGIIPRKLAAGEEVGKFGGRWMEVRRKLGYTASMRRRKVLGYDGAVGGEGILEGIQGNLKSNFVKETSAYITSSYISG